MAPLALMLLRQGHKLYGSDRSYDQGQSLEKFKALQEAGVKLFPQDGSGVTSNIDTLVVSSAIEKTIPDVEAALSQNIPVRKRAEILAELFNTSQTGISVAGTSGKSTTTGMIAVMLEGLGLDPDVVNGGLIRNFDSAMRVGAGALFVVESDESDGSIALFNPAIAVLNNIALDHKSIEELETLFADFITRASKAAVLNFDDARVKSLAGSDCAPFLSYAIDNEAADLRAVNLSFEPTSVAFTLRESGGGSYPVRLNVPGAHNVSNALAALSVAKILELDMVKAINALEGFKGIARRFEIVGSQKGITLIDDFAHNPDKIAATLKVLKEFDGRLLVMFQPHGFGPLKLMGNELIHTFVEYLGDEDVLLMPEAYYAGGTADKSISSRKIIESVQNAGKKAHFFERRADIAPFLQKNARKGDRIIIMGARDDTLSDFAWEVLNFV